MENAWPGTSLRLLLLPGPLTGLAAEHANVKTELIPSLLVHGARGLRVPGVEGFAASELRLWFSAHFPKPSHLSPVPGPLDITEAPSCAEMDENGYEIYFVKLNSCPRR